MKPEECLAIHAGETRVAALDGEVVIVRDRWGVPHIRAATRHDAFFAQGFCMAQDRAWQIELIRHMAHGRAANLLNRNLVGLDMQNRGLGFSEAATREWPTQSAEAREVLEAYAAGVNAAIQTQPRPFEFRVLGHDMLPWQPVDSLAIIKLVNSGQQWASKLKFGQVGARLGPAAVSALVPDVPPGAALIIPSGAAWTGETHPFREDVERALGEPDGPVGSGGGSNCWVIHGSRTESGAPLVCGDPHLQMTLPGQWYVVHMECPEFTVAGPCNPGYPGPVFYGHNTKVAWAMTHAQGDRWDLYRERIRMGALGPEAEFRGAWEPLTFREECFEARDGDSVTIRAWRTRHGPVIFGEPERDAEVIAARWGLADPAHDMDAMLALLRSASIQDAHAALRLYDSVSGNFCFADTAGNIGYQYTGRIPRRGAWLVPVPGWTGDHEWQGDVPKEELPAEDNPRRGYIITANNKTTTPDYPYYLTFVSTRLRADRLRELFESVDRFTIDDMRRFQADQTSIRARDLAALLVSRSRSPSNRRLREMLAGWDGHLSPSSAAAAALHLVSDALLERTFRVTLGELEVAPELTAAEEARILHEELSTGSAALLPPGVTWEGAIEAAFTAAEERLAKIFGENRDLWRWDELHRLRWRHNLGRDSELGDVLNLAEVPIGGDASTPFATAADHAGYVTLGVSFRQILDLGDLNAAQVCIPPGNSGQPGSRHYADNVERWRNVEYHPLFIDWRDITANAEATLKLTPLQ